MIKDFYRLKELTSEDLAFVEGVCIRNAPAPVQPLLRGWIPAFVAVFELRREFERLGIDVTGSPDGEMFDVAINNLEEDLHGSIEVGAIGQLDALRAGDMGFLESDDELSSFLHYLCVQYLRTNNQMHKARAAAGTFPGVNFENAWGLMRHVLATNLAYGIYSRRESIRSTLLQAGGRESFLTSDQPVINLIAVGVPEETEVETLAFYYPVSPSRAFLMEVEQEGRSCSVQDISADEVARYNRAIIDQMHEQAFALDEADLLQIRNTG